MLRKKDIETLIAEEKESKLATHFYDALTYNTTKYSGEVRKDEILLWSSSYWLRGGYPIFHLHFNTENLLVKITTEPNPFGKLINKLAIIAIVFFTLLPIIGYGLTEGWFLSLFVLFVATVVFFIMRKSGINEKQIMTQELKEAIEAIEKAKFPEKFLGQLENPEPLKNEWTFKKIIVRLIMYPICALIIYVSIVFALPGGKPIHGLIAIGICVLYYVADLSNIIKHNKKAPNPTQQNDSD